MGHQFSKSEAGVDASSSNLLHHHPRSTSSRKVVLDNDGLSRATEITDESMTPPPSPRVGKSRHNESWRRGAGVPSNTTAASTLRTSYPMANGSHSVNGIHTSSAAAFQSQHRHGLLPRRDSDPGHPSELLLPQQQPRTVPVKCPPRKRHAASGDAVDGMEASYLERMYDSRTWEMYRRITEARKQSRNVTNAGAAATASASSSAMDPRQGPRGIACSTNTSRLSDDTSEWENLQHEEETSGEEAHHEMIFLFDF